METAQLGDRLVHCLLQRSTVADVDDRRNRAATGLFDQLDRLVQILPGSKRVLVGFDVGAHVQSDDVGTLVGKMDRVAAALSAGGTGYHGHLAVQTLHLLLHRHSTSQLLDRVPGPRRRTVPAGGATPTILLDNRTLSVNLSRVWIRRLVRFA